MDSDHNVYNTFQFADICFTLIFLISNQKYHQFIKFKENDNKNNNYENKFVITPIVLFRFQHCCL